MISKQIYITMPDRSVWAIPWTFVFKIYCEESGEEAATSEQLKEWAQNNMNWDDVKKSARRVQNPPLLTEDEFQDAWVNGQWEIR